MNINIAISDTCSNLSERYPNAAILNLKSGTSIIEYFEQTTGDISVLILNKAEIKEESLPPVEQDTSMIYHSPAIYMEGSVRDDFDFGDVLIINNQLAKKAIEKMDAGTVHCGLYDLRLSLSTLGQIAKSEKPFYQALENTDSDFETTHFAYCDPRNRAYQIEAEKVFTKYLADTGALIEYQDRTVKDFESIISKYKTLASVIIPVRNRQETIADAVRSALEQQTSFTSNVIVVNNHSNDATSKILKDLAKENDRLVIIEPEETDLGIGGCWNKAINSPQCGAIAIQLDSDDVYSNNQVISTIVRKFMEEHCGILVGSYRLTNMQMQPLNDMIIDHREYTQENGTNNALRVNGFGAPRCYLTELVRQNQFSNVSYGEDYDLCLRLSRKYKLSRIYDVLYLCRRWEKNSDANLTPEKLVRFNEIKDTFRTRELACRRSADRAPEQ